jgi:hypothetical protein
MELITHKKLKAGRLMPWGKGTVVTGAKGFVFLAGNTATTNDYAPFEKVVVAPWATPPRSGATYLQHQIRPGGTRHLAGPPGQAYVFRERALSWRGVLSSPNFRQDVMDEFFAQHCPKQCSAHPELVIEIVAVAALPD